MRRLGETQVAKLNTRLAVSNLEALCAGAKAHLESHIGKGLDLGAKGVLLHAHAVAEVNVRDGYKAPDARRGWYRYTPLEVKENDKEYHAADA